MNDFVDPIELQNTEINELHNEDLDSLLNKYFSGRVVRKDLTKQLKEGANVPVYVLEYEKKDVYEAALSNLGIKDALVPTPIVKQNEKLLTGGIWCIINAQYFYEEGQKTSPFSIQSLKPIQIPSMDMEEIFEARKHFTVDQ